MVAKQKLVNQGLLEHLADYSVIKYKILNSLPRSGREIPNAHFVLGEKKSLKK